MLSQVTSSYGNVKIERFHGLLVDFCAANGITAVIKGLRAVSDFEYEMQMAQMNYRMAKIETLFMTTNPLYSFLSSSLIKEIARYGGDVSGLVPEPVLSRLHARLSELSRGNDPPGDPPNHGGVPPPLPPRRGRPRDGACDAGYVVGGCRSWSAVFPWRKRWLAPSWE